MDVHVYLAFVIATTVMIALPGPSVLLTVAHSMSFGWRRALATVAGATVGIAVQSVLRTAGGLMIVAGAGLALSRRGG
jgi:threonine/homoserine/homoserine lactone efflux protein